MPSESTPSISQLQQEILALQNQKAALEAELDHCRHRNLELDQDKVDLEIQLEVATEHADLIMADLYSKAKQLAQDYGDLQIILDTAVQHGDLVEDLALTASQSKSRFLAFMSHELRTPLNAILGFTQLLMRDPALTPVQQEWITTINRSGEHLLNLINDVLEMSRIEAGQLRLSLEPVNLLGLLMDLEALMRVRTEARGLQLEINLESDLPTQIQTDAGKLRQVLLNLLSNAVKFTPSGQIALRVHWVGSQTLKFEVTDTGIGISAEEISKLFQPFVQTSSGVKAGGSGLGLAISYQIVHMMGGEMQVSSLVGQGSKFSFTLPVEPTEVMISDMHSLKVVGLAPHQPRHRILIADDIQEDGELLVQWLTLVGIETQVACNGREAIEQWETWSPHLILMDMKMPDMDGYEATWVIKQRGGVAAPKIIAMTASAFREQQAAILEAGCDDIITKPVREDILFKLLQEQLGIEFIYEVPKTAQNAPTLRTYPPPPQPWRERFQMAVISLDTEGMQRLISEFRTHDPDLAEQLDTLVMNFRFHELETWIQSLPYE
jgi:signal transduction histidine kinase/CheY-like chemotaxis protein